MDFSVLRNSPQERAQARVTGGAIRSTPGGARIRALHAGDTGRVISGPVPAAITQGPQTSLKLWWQVQWDSGPLGWASEDLLIRSSTLDLQPAQAVYGGWPHDLTGVRIDSALTWCTGANTANQHLYVGTTPALGAGDLKFSGLVNQWSPAGPFTPFTRYYWRVDTISAQGAVLSGPVWTFLTRPPEPAPVVLETVVTSPTVPQPGFPFVITCSTRSPSGQPVLVGASLHRVNTTPLDDSPNDVPRFAPAGAGSFTRNFTLPLTTPPGSYTLLVRLIQDYNGNGEIDPLDTVIAEKRQAMLVAPAGPLVNGLTVSPPVMAPGQQAVITASVQALPGSSLVLLKLFRAEGATAPGPWTQVQSVNLNNAGQYDVFLTDRPPSIRRYWYALQAFDNLGRGAPDGPYFVPVSVLVTLNDHTPPVLTWLAPADGVVMAPNGMIAGTLTDNDQIESAARRTDDGLWEPIGLTGWQFPPAAPAGPHRISIRAVDRSGNAVEQTRLYYMAPVPDGSDFDEDQRFAGLTDHFPSWIQGLAGTGGVANGRLEATGSGSSVMLSRFKRPPFTAPWIEVSYQCGLLGGSMTWDRTFWSRVVVRVVPTAPGQWQLQAGELNQYQSLPLNLSGLGPDARLSVFIRLANGRLYCRVVTADAAATELMESLQVMGNLFLDDLRECTFQTAGSGEATAWLDDLSFRALRAENALACRNLLALPPAGGGRPLVVEWASVPGRLYQLEQIDPLTGGWTRTDPPVAGTGLVTRHLLTFPAARRGALLRVRQLLP